MGFLCSIKKMVKDNLSFFVILVFILGYLFYIRDRSEKFTSPDEGQKMAFQMKPSDLETAAAVTGRVEIPKTNLPEKFTTEEDKDKLYCEIGKAIIEGTATFQAIRNTDGVDILNK